MGGPAQGTSRRPANRTLPVLVALCLATAATLPSPRPQETQHPAKVLVLSSMKIRPYEQLANEMRGKLKNADTSILFLDEDPSAPARIQEVSPAAILTVGQEALKAALPLRRNIPLVFTMVLFPQEVVHDGGGVTGIGMIPSPRLQLHALQSGFRFNRILVFYNPSVTQFLVDQFKEGTPPGMKLNAVAVDSDAELVSHLESGLGETDAVLLVPDPTLLTEQGLKSLITTCYGSNVPLVGFSPMYLTMGAAVTLSVTEDQTAKMAVALALSSEVKGERHEDVVYPSTCKIQVSRKAASRLGLKVDRAALKPYGNFEWGD